MGEPEYIGIAFATSISTFCLWNVVAERFCLSTNDAWEFWLDTIGMGSFTCVGTMNGIRAGIPPPLIALCGMMTATFGGLTRDVLSRYAHSVCPHCPAPHAVLQRSASCLPPPACLPTPAPFCRNHDPASTSIRLHGQVPAHF